MKVELLDSIYQACSKKPSLAKLVESFKKEMPVDQSVVSSPDESSISGQDDSIKIAYDCVNDLLSEASRFVQDTLATLLIRKWHEPDVLEQIPVLLERLLNGIPPNEIIKQVDVTPGQYKYQTIPAEFTAILMAGWIYETYWQETFVSKEQMMPYSTMSRLLLKACEDISTIEQKEVRGVCSDKTCNPEGA